VKRVLASCVVELGIIRKIAPATRRATRTPTSSNAIIAVASGIRTSLAPALQSGHLRAFVISVAAKDTPPRIAPQRNPRKVAARAKAQWSWSVTIAEVWDTQQRIAPVEHAATVAKAMAM